MRKTWLVPTMALLIAASAAASSAQQPADRPATGATTEDRRYGDRDDRPGFGWIGLLGLAGLLGLRGRTADRSRETYAGTQHTTPAR
jgi:hypothetical protein